MAEKLRLNKIKGANVSHACSLLKGVVSRLEKYKDPKKQFCLPNSMHCCFLLQQFLCVGFDTVEDSHHHTTSNARCRS